MKTLYRKLSSRKFLTLVTGWIITGATAGAGAIDGTTFIAAIVVQGTAYILGEAGVDALGRVAGAIHAAVRAWKDSQSSLR